jgi:hypothetical protein
MQSLVFFTDLTHWVYAEYGLVHIFYGPDRDGNEPPHWGHWMYEQHPDDAMYQVYDRRTFHARPAAFHKIFQETMRYGEGDLTYSEGHHDQFNQWMWQRLMWDPQMTIDQVLDEYGRLFFGPEAAPGMAQALLQFEQNLSTPIAANDGIDRYYGLLKDAARKMPTWRMKNNYLWRQHMQRAALDKYIQLRLREQTRREHDIEHIIDAGIQKDNLDAVVQKVREKLDADIETGEMKKLKAEAGELGAESDAIFGVRNEGFFNLDQDFIGLKWIRKQVELASGAPLERQRELLTRLVRYEDPGEGGFYDDAGDPARSPHMVHVWQCSEDDVADTNRISQRTMAFTREEKQGVAFAYTGLDPAAAYRARFTFVRPRYLKRYADRQPQRTQSIYANDILLAKDVELPEWEADFFEYAVPREATRSGKLELRLEKASGVGEGTPAQIGIWRNTGGWGTLVSEVWLIKEK